MVFPSDSMAATDGFRKEVVAGEPTLVYRSKRRWGRADLAMDGRRQEQGEKQQVRKGKQVQEETKTVEPKDEPMEDSAAEEASKAEAKPKFKHSRKQSRARPAASYAVVETRPDRKPELKVQTKVEVKEELPSDTESEEEEVQRTRTKRRKLQQQQKGWKDAKLKSEEEDMAKVEAVGKGKHDDVDDDAGRCKRSDGKSWRCSRPLYRDGWCTYHYEYYEAKRLKLPLPPAPKRQKKTKTQRRKRGIEVDSEYDSEEKKQVIPAGKGQKTKAPSEGIAPRGTRSSPTGADKVEDSSSRSRSSDSEAAETAENVRRGVGSVRKGGKVCHPNRCHQCWRLGTVVACRTCVNEPIHRRYCPPCIEKWYPNLKKSDVEKKCPHCRGFCNCKTCLRRGRPVVEEDATCRVDNLHYLLRKLLPSLIHLHEEQDAELNLERELRGDPAYEVVTMPISVQERMYCNKCKTSIVDYYRTCTECEYDLCLFCCQEMREHRREKDEAREREDCPQAVMEAGNDALAVTLDEGDACRSAVTEEGDAVGAPMDSAVDPAGAVEEEGHQTAVEAEGHQTAVEEEGHQTAVEEEGHQTAAEEGHQTAVEEEGHQTAVEEEGYQTAITGPGTCSQEADQEQKKVHDVASSEATEGGMDPLVAVEGEESGASALEEENEETGPSAAEKASASTSVAAAVDAGPSSAVGEGEVSNVEDMHHEDGGLTYSSLWEANADGSIVCAPKDWGGCGSGHLCLRSLQGPNTLKQVVRDVERILGPTIEDHQEESPGCTFCLQNSKSADGRLLLAAHRDAAEDNYLFSPKVQELDGKSLLHFQQHWSRGQPVIVKNVNELGTGLSWEPMVMWRAVREKSKKKKQVDPTLTVKAIECLSGCEMEIDIKKFFERYTERRVVRNGAPPSDMYKLKDWPPSSSFSERLPRHHAEFLLCLPFKHYTHPEVGVLNLATKYPEGALRPDLGPKTYIAYGVREEMGAGDSVTKLHCDMSDAVNVLMHSKGFKAGKSPKEAIELKGEQSSDPQTSGGALWDIFRREDVGKLQEYILKHWTEFFDSNKPEEGITHPVHDQLFYLTEEHKRRLKAELGIEAWTFEQHVGDAVFIPAGCPHQVRNLQSCIKVAMDFVSPENVEQCVKLTEEFRMLPNSHPSKEDKLEVRKMLFQAAKLAVQDLEKSSKRTTPKELPKEALAQSRKRRRKGVPQGSKPS